MTVETRVYLTGRSDPSERWAYCIHINGKRVARGAHLESSSAHHALRHALLELQRDIAKALLSL